MAASRIMDEGTDSSLYTDAAVDRNSAAFVPSGLPFPPQIAAGRQPLACSPYMNNHNVGHQHQLVGIQPTKMHFDAALVFAKANEDEAQEILEAMMKMKLKTGEFPKVCLFDNPEFDGNDITRPQNVVKVCTLIFVILSKDLDEDTAAQLIKDEAIGLTRLASTEDIGCEVQAGRKYCVRPLHTKAPKERDYKVPCGLTTITPIDWYDINKPIRQNKIKQLFEYHLEYRKLRERKDLLEQGPNPAGPGPCIRHHALQQRQLDNGQSLQDEFHPSATGPADQNRTDHDEFSPAVESNNRRQQEHDDDWDPRGPELQRNESVDISDQGREGTGSTSSRFRSGSPEGSQQIPVRHQRESRYSWAISDSGRGTFHPANSIIEQASDGTEIPSNSALNVEEDSKSSFLAGGRQNGSQDTSGMRDSPATESTSDDASQGSVNRSRTTSSSSQVESTGFEPVAQESDNRDDDFDIRHNNEPLPPGAVAAAGAGDASAAVTQDQQASVPSSAQPAEGTSHDQASVQAQQGANTESLSLDGRPKMENLTVSSQSVRESGEESAEEQDLLETNLSIDSSMKLEKKDDDPKPADTTVPSAVALNQQQQAPHPSGISKMSSVCNSPGPNATEGFVLSDSEDMKDGGDETKTMEVTHLRYTGLAHEHVARSAAPNTGQDGKGYGAGIEVPSQIHYHIYPAPGQYDHTLPPPLYPGAPPFIPQGVPGYAPRPAAEVASVGSVTHPLEPRPSQAQQIQGDINWKTAPINIVNCKNVQIGPGGQMQMTSGNDKASEDMDSEDDDNDQDEMMSDPPKSQRRHQQTTRKKQHEKRKRSHGIYVDPEPAMVLSDLPEDRQQIGGRESVSSSRLFQIPGDIGRDSSKSSSTSLGGVSQVSRDCFPSKRLEPVLARPGLGTSPTQHTATGTYSATDSGESWTVPELPSLDDLRPLLMENTEQETGGKGEKSSEDTNMLESDSAQTPRPAPAAEEQAPKLDKVAFPKQEPGNFRNKRGQEFHHVASLLKLNNPQKQF